MSGSNIIRVVASALVLSTLSFAAGVAGDLSLTDPPNYGTRVVVRIPPPIPSDAPRAAPLISTSAADAMPVHRRIAMRVEQPRAAVSAHALVKPHRHLAAAEGPKLDPDHAPKPELA